MIHCCLYARWLVMGRCPVVWVNVCHFPHKWKHLDTEVCPEVRAVEALTHKVAGRQPGRKWARQTGGGRRASHTHTEGPHTHADRHMLVNHTLVNVLVVLCPMSVTVSFFTDGSSCVWLPVFLPDTVVSLAKRTQPVLYLHVVWWWLKGWLTSLWTNTSAEPPVEVHHRIQNNVGWLLKHNGTSHFF